MLMREIENSSLEHIHETVADAMSEVHEHLIDEDAREVFKRWGVWNNGVFDFDDAQAEVLSAWQERPEIGIYGAAGQIAIDRLVEITVSKEVELEEKLSKQLGEHDLEGYWVGTIDHYLVASDISLDDLVDPQSKSTGLEYSMPGTPDPIINNRISARQFDSVFRVLPENVPFF